MILKGKGFVLRPYAKGDEISLKKNINSKEISRFMSRLPFPYTIKEARKWINLCQKRKKQKKRSEINFAIDIKGEVVGGLGLMHIEKDHKAELGYWLGKCYWNMGIMTEAIKLVCNFGFKKLKLKRIYVKVFSKNKASARVLEKNGFKYEGLMKKEFSKKGKLYDSLMFAKLK